MKQNIISGPDRFALLMNFVRHEAVTIGIRQGEDAHSVEAVVTTLELENGSGFTFIMKGHLLGSNIKFEAFYDTRARSGWFTA